MSIPSLAAALALYLAVPEAARPPGVYVGDQALCNLEQPGVSTRFERPAHLPRAPKLRLVLGQAARDFGITEESLLFIERRLGGMILIDTAISVTAASDREAHYDVVPLAELRLDDYAFATMKDSAITFFGCHFTTLP